MFKTSVKNNKGYMLVYAPGHPRARNDFVLEHLIVVEKALGFYLTEPHQVHHFNERRADNSNQNLVVCENQKYHYLLHVRQKTVKAGGNPNFEKVCSLCSKIKLKKLFWKDHRLGDGLRASCSACDVLKRIK